LEAQDIPVTKRKVPVKVVFSIGGTGDVSFKQSNKDREDSSKGLVGDSSA
jgi:hypothetical protein